VASVFLPFTRRQCKPFRVLPYRFGNPGFELRQVFSVSESGNCRVVPIANRVKSDTCGFALARQPQELLWPKYSRDNPQSVSPCFTTTLVRGRGAAGFDHSGTTMVVPACNDSAG